MKFRTYFFILFALVLGLQTGFSQTSFNEVKKELSTITDQQDWYVDLESKCLQYIWDEPFLADSLVKLLRKASEKNNDSFYVGRAIYFSGLLEFNWRNIDEAYKKYIEAREYFVALDSQRALAETFHNMALVHYELRDSAQFVDFLNKARKINKKHSYFAQLIKNEFALANLAQSKQDQLEKYVAIRDSCIKFGYDEGVLLGDLNSGIVSYHMGLYDQTLEFVENAEQVMQRTGITKYASELYETKAAAYWIEENYLKAEEYFQKALEGYQKKGARMRIGEVYMNLSQISQQRGELDSSISYMMKYIILQDSIQIENKSQIIKEAEAGYKLAYKEKENTLLRKEAKLDQAKLEVATKQRILLILLLVITLTTIALLTARYYTKQKHYNELESMNSQLSSLNLEMESILQVVSHDFRTPLAKIKVAGELVGLQEKNLSEKSEAKLKAIQVSVSEAEQLVSDILEVKQFMSEDARVLDPQVFDIEAEINGICNQFSQPVTLKNIDLTYGHEGPKEIFVVKEMVKRIVTNLVSNAVKFVPNEGKIKVSSKQANDRLIIVVKDNGPGFNEEDKQKVFQKFSKFSNKPIGWGTSHGLGLFIVHKLVTRLDGTIELKSSEGEGAEFTVEIPSVLIVE
jgi:signal transduction histidine kinase